MRDLIPAHHGSATGSTLPLPQSDFSNCLRLTSSNDLYSSAVFSPCPYYMPLSQPNLHGRSCGITQALWQCSSHTWRPSQPKLVVRASAVHERRCRGLSSHPNPSRPAALSLWHGSPHLSVHTALASLRVGNDDALRAAFCCSCRCLGLECCSPMCAAASARLALLHRLLLLRLGGGAAPDGK